MGSSIGLRGTLGGQFTSNWDHRRAACPRGIALIRHGIQGENQSFGRLGTQIHVVPAAMLQLQCFFLSSIDRGTKENC